VPHEILTASELAAKLKVHPTTVRLWTRQGLPHRSLGPRLVRFDTRQALAWLESRPKLTPPRVVHKHRQQAKAAL
jgi:phage terminase Nu1 subunit (DNA packaging protein)